MRQSWHKFRNIVQTFSFFYAQGKWRLQHCLTDLAASFLAVFFAVCPVLRNFAARKAQAAKKDGRYSLNGQTTW